MRNLFASLTVLGASLSAAPAAVAAGLGQPVDWQMNLQESASPVMTFITSFHNGLVILITIICLFVLGLLIWVCVKFNAKANPVPSRTTHNTLVEVVWTVVPILILIGIAIPSFRLLYFQRDFPAAEMTVKAIGNQWFWSYEYPEHDVSFDQYLKTKEELKDGEPYLLATDTEVVVPVNKVVRVIVTANDVLHAWTIPSFGSKIDAVPGRLNETWFKAEKEGVFYGQCSELCGKDHAYMPITVRVVSEDEYAAWLEKAKTAGVEQAQEHLAGILKTKGKLALGASGGSAN
ncbi:MAG: cytochrome c oxidase subunit II [Anderseniella sp.]|nr:cytochrome c oxidase subunit II [Anderseniella sp.]